MRRSCAARKIERLLDPQTGKEKRRADRSNNDFSLEGAHFALLLINHAFTNEDGSTGLQHPVANDASLDGDGIAGTCYPVGLCRSAGTPTRSIGCVRSPDNVAVHRSISSERQHHMSVTITQRQSFIAISAIVGVGALLYGALSIFAGEWSQVIVGLLGLLIVTLTLAAYLRGWEYARHVLVCAFVILIVFGGVDVETVYRPSLLVPPALALVLLSPPWVIGVAIVGVLGMGVRTSWSTPHLDPLNLLIYAIIVGLMLLARAILNTTTWQAEVARRQAEEARARAESLVEWLAEANAAQQTQLEEQRRLLELVATLETPAISLADGVLFAPIVGHVDSRRASALMRRLLEAAHNEHAHRVIIDISGVATVDSTVAKAIVDTAQALKLLGCDVTLSGISSKVALTLTQQGIAISDVATVRSPQEALQRSGNRG